MKKTLEKNNWQNYYLTLVIPFYKSQLIHRHANNDDDGNNNNTKMGNFYLILEFI